MEDGTSMVSVIKTISGFRLMQTRAETSTMDDSSAAWKCGSCCFSSSRNILCF